jgi:hypothetical protein
MPASLTTNAARRCAPGRARRRSRSCGRTVGSRCAAACRPRAGRLSAVGRSGCPSPRTRPGGAGQPASAACDRAGGDRAAVGQGDDTAAPAPPDHGPPASCTSWAARVPACTAARSASSASEIPPGTRGSPRSRTSSPAPARARSRPARPRPGRRWPHGPQPPARPRPPQPAPGGSLRQPAAGRPVTGIEGRPPRLGRLLWRGEPAEQT